MPILDPIEIGKALRGNITRSKRSDGWDATAAPTTEEHHQSTPNLHCTNCNVNTAGVLETIESTSRRCPGCSSILMYCPSCHSLVSATERFNVLSCDRCHADFVMPSTIEHLMSRDREAREIVLSGVRPTGDLHLGNYLGAIKRFVEFQTENNFCLYFIADIHSLTQVTGPTEVSDTVMEVAMNYLAAGLDPKRSIIYAQSSVPEIPELALYLSMVQPKNRIEGMPTIKDDVRNGVMNMGHLMYPVLMAADILGPRATIVPVGTDQLSHIELARDLAEKFNRMFKTTFVIPKPISETILVPGLGGGKMSKSVANSAVDLVDSLEEITRKYMKYGITDPARTRKDIPGTPEKCVSVFPVHKILQAKNPEALEKIISGCTSAGLSCSECKTTLARDIFALTGPIAEKRRALESQKKLVREILYYGGLKAREIIRPTLEEVREKMGIGNH